MLSINDDGKISLSISKQAKTNKPVEIEWNKQDDIQKNMSFEDKLNQFLWIAMRMDQLKPGTQEEMA